MGVNREHSTGVLNLTGCYSLDMFQGDCYYGARCAQTRVRGESLLSVRVDCIVKRNEKNVGARACYTLRGSKAVGGNDKVRKRCGM
jgi:outer membrane lipoprotein SlyB